MNGLIDFYQQQANKGPTTIPWLDALKKKGLEEFKRLNFPSRYHEDWKYTSVDSFLKQPFIQEKTNSQGQWMDSSLPHASCLRIQNGQLMEQTNLSQLPSQLVIKSLKEGITQYGDKLKSFLGKALRHEHGFQALNTAMLASGVFLYLPAGVKVKTPIVLSHWQDQNLKANYHRCLIIAEEGSEATIVEEFRGAEACCYFQSTVTEVFVQSAAKIVHYKLQLEGKEAYHIGQLSVLQDKGSRFESHSFSLGGKLVRSDTSLRLQEENAACLLNGIYAPTEGQHIDHHTEIDHLVPNCQSEQDYKGILNGRSRAVFNGKIVVSKGAQHSSAKQQNKNLLLSTGAEIDTKPQLEIFADDVICTHGATVGQLDEDALFYLATRGIDKQEAGRYLVQAFAEDNLRLVPDKNLASWMSNLLNEQLR